MVAIFRTGWRRDLLVGLLASVVTGAVLVPVGWAALERQRADADDARRLALQAARLAQGDAARARDQAQRALVNQAADVLGNVGGPEKGDAEALRVMTEAVAPEIPRGAFVLIDKKAAAYAAGDIVVFRVGENNYLGRVLTVEPEARRLTVGRNGEENRQVTFAEVLGRGVLNTR